MPLLEVSSMDDRQLQDTADLLAKSHKILVITGAGISTSCGIPDFRSKDGLYSLIQDKCGSGSFQIPSARLPTSSQEAASDSDLPPSSQSSYASSASHSSSSASRNLKGQDLFDASVWKNPTNTAVFYKFIASLRNKIREEVKETTLTHKFIRTLRDGGRLMRCYTQNIDGLEAREGLSMNLVKGKGSKRRFVRSIYEAPRPNDPIPKGSDFDGGCEVVPLHGDLDQLRCSLCQHLCSWDGEKTEMFLCGEAPACQKCCAKNQNRKDSGKRGLSVGLLRPNIVLYQEEHPSSPLLAPLPPFDIGLKPEVLLIMGTSLKVHGLQKLIREFAKAIHGRKGSKGRVVFVNRTKPAESIWNDYIDEWVGMDCDDWVRDLKMRREDLWLRQGELALPITKPVAKPGKGKSSNKPPKVEVVAERTNRVDSDNRLSGKSVIDSVVVVNSFEAIKPKKISRKRKTPEPKPALPTPPASKHKPPKNDMDRHDSSVKQAELSSPPDTPSKKRKIAVYEDPGLVTKNVYPDPVTDFRALKQRPAASENSVSLPETLGEKRKRGRPRKIFQEEIEVRPSR